MKAFFRLLALVLAVFLLVSCGTSPSLSADILNEDSSAAVEAPASGAEIALITTEARLDSAFGQSVWQAVSRFAGEAGYTPAVYRAEEEKNAALSTLELAVKGGAQLVLTMDPSVTAAIAGVQAVHTTVDFILLDVAEDISPQRHSVCVRFSAEQAGWLAGYVATYQGFASLGLLNGISETSQLYTLGFLLGAEAAAARMAVTSGDEAAATMVLLPGLGVSPVDGPSSASSAPQEEPAMDEIDQLLQAEPQLVFCTEPDLEQAVLEKLSGTDSRLLGLPCAQSISGRVVASIAHEPKRMVQSLLEKWDNGRFPAGSELLGTVGDGDITVVSKSTVAQNEWDAAIAKGVGSFDDGELARHLQQAVTSGPDDTPPLPEELVPELTHIQVRPPYPANATAPMEDELGQEASASQTI
ncbi:BMP family ABC transporter substrate-binding protein [Clostridia bacterium OttesenSCG-928-O13]|nr:BMP family ABC transporter substrate-binding protein [Clostridia bacterium OttesenSCG-928-O13]